MKTWCIDEFLSECEHLGQNPFFYDNGRMPAGVCNGHTVSLYPREWHSVVIDGRVCNIGHCTVDYPNGMGCYVVDGAKIAPLEYVRYLLNK